MPGLTRVDAVEAPVEKLLRLKQLNQQKATLLARRHQLYATKPVEWVEDVLGETLWSKQQEIMTAVKDYRKVAVRSCHDIGKSYTVSRIMAWWVSCHPVDDVFIVSTAPSAPQVRAILWRELHKAHVKGKLPGRLTQVEWKINDQLVGYGRKPSDYEPDAFQGIHAKYVLVVLDEANGIPDSLWAAALSLAANDDSRIVAIGNPDDPVSHFAKVSLPGSGWHTIQVGYLDTPNFSGEDIAEDIKELLIGPSYVAEMQQEYGEESPIYISKVLGEFPEQAADALIPIHAVRQAQARSLARTTPHVLSVDVARFGTDKSVIGERRGDHYRTLRRITSNDTTQLVGLVKSLYEELKPEQIIIDATGVGAGVYDFLAEEGYPVQGAEWGRSARNKKRFANQRAEWFWKLRSKFLEGELDISADEDALASQLCVLKYKQNSRSQIVMESKDDMRGRGIPSPDDADAMAMAYGVEDMSWDDVYTKASDPEDEVVESSDDSSWGEVYG